jgi:hypothetical protein
MLRAGAGRTAGVLLVVWWVVVVVVVVWVGDSLHLTVCMCIRRCLLVSVFSRWATSSL